MTETLGDWEQPGRGPHPGDAVARRDARRRELERLYDEVDRIEAELGIASLPLPAWAGRRPASFVLAGLLVGFVGAAASLLFHMVGALAMQNNPLQVVRIYLTLLRGERALANDTGRWLALGTCLYLLGGACYGILFHQVLGRWFPQAPGIWRLLVSSAMGVMIWLVNFYLLLSWLQPLLTGGPSVLQLIPFWLAALTHLVFAWTIFFMEEWGRPGHPSA